MKNGASGSQRRHLGRKSPLEEALPLRLSLLDPAPVPW